MGITVDKTGRRMDKSFKRASKSANVFRGVLKGVIVAGAVRRGAMLASNAIRGLSEEFIEFDRNITKAVTRLPGGLDRTSDAFRQLGAVARVEAKRTEFTAGEAALAVEQLALAGFGLEKVAATLPGVLNLATNADVELAQAARMATKTLGAFGLTVDDVAQQQINLTRVNDVFSRTVSTASINMEDLFEVMKFGGPAAFAAGQQIETFAATAGVLANSAIDASIAGTSLRSMFVRLAAPTPKARKLIKKLGIDIKDSKGNFKDFFDIMDDVRKGTAKMGNAQKLAALDVLFGKRSINAANVILNKGSKELRDYRTQMENAGGASAKMSKTIRTSIEGRLLRLKSALVETGFKFIEAFNKNAGSSIEAAIKAVSRFDVGPVIKDLKEMIQSSKDLFNAVSPFLPLLPKVLAFWVSYKILMKAVVLLKSAQAFLSLAVAVKAAAGAQGLLNIALLFSPIGLITFAVIGLSAALAILITDFDSVSGGWEAMFVHMEILSLKFGKFLKQMVNGILLILLEIPKILTKGTALEGAAKKFFKFKIGTEVDDAAIKEAENRLRETQEATTFGDQASVRRHDFPSQRNLPRVPKAPAGPSQADIVAADILGIFKAGVASAAQVRENTFTPQGPLAPNRSQIEAQRVLFEANINVANAPRGTTVDTSTSRGAPKIKENRLGEQ